MLPARSVDGWHMRCTCSRSIAKQVTASSPETEAPMIVVHLLIAMLGAAAALFALQNPEPTAVSFFHWRSAYLPLSLLMLLSALAGGFLPPLRSLAPPLRP